MSTTPRKPDYRLRIKERNGDRSASIGAAWTMPDGRIAIRLDVGVVLQERNDFIVALFPNETAAPNPERLTPASYKSADEIPPF